MSGVHRLTAPHLRSRPATYPASGLVSAGNGVGRHVVREGSKQVRPLPFWTRSRPVSDQNYMDFNKYQRNAVFGERVLFYETGSRDTPPMMGWVARSDEYTVLIKALGENSSRFQTFRAVRHIDDPHFDLHPHTRAKIGGWDFDPIFCHEVNRQLNLQNARQARAEQLESEKHEMSPEEFDDKVSLEAALKALDEHGANMSAISRDTKLSPNKLNSFPEFKDAYQKAKVAEWEEKQSANISK